MKILLAGLFLLCLAAAAISQVPALTDKDYVRVAPQLKSGFAYPYYFYVPASLKDRAKRKLKSTILVLPNNTAKGPSDDFADHENDVKKRMAMAGAVAAALDVAVLMPVFPRPKKDWTIYTLALDRDSMVTDREDLRRFDLQLIAMVDDLRSKMKKDGIELGKKILLNGFSAQAMFANRFTFLHPDRVKAAAIGSPGGWPIAPVENYKGKPLRYPIGVADLQQVSGHKLDIKKLRQVPIFVFIGDKDENDSVPFGDSYDDEDRELVNSLLGKTPVDRFPLSEALYKQAGLNANFKTYPGVAHTVSDQMRTDIRAFLSKYAN